MCNVCQGLRVQLKPAVAMKTRPKIMKTWNKGRVISTFQRTGVSYRNSDSLHNESMTNNILAIGMWTVKQWKEAGNTALPGRQFPLIPSSSLHCCSQPQEGVGRWLQCLASCFFPGLLGLYCQPDGAALAPGSLPHLPQLHRATGWSPVPPSPSPWDAASSVTTDAAETGRVRWK